MQKSEVSSTTNLDPKLVKSNDALHLHLHEVNETDKGFFYKVHLKYTGMIQVLKASTCFSDVSQMDINTFSRNYQKCIS